MIENEHLNGQILANTNTHEFIKIAKEYKISASQGRKILNAFRTYPFENKLKKRQNGNTEQVL